MRRRGRYCINGKWYQSLWLRKTPGSITIAAASTTNTATIAAVDLNNTTLEWNGLSTDRDSDSTANTFAHVALTNATTVTATRGNNSNAVTVYFTVVEWVPGVWKSIQRGTIVVNGTTGNTATIAAVNTARAEVAWLGCLSAFDSAGRGHLYLFINDATTITAGKGVATSSATVSYEVRETY